jgi:hypothetical protein
MEQDEKLNLKNVVDKSHPSTPVWVVNRTLLHYCFGPFGPLSEIILTSCSGMKKFTAIC